MFKSLVQTVFPSLSKDKGFTPDYLSFERSRDMSNSANSTEANCEAKLVSHAMKVDLFADFLFGDSEYNTKGDPLSLYVASKIKELIQQPEKLLSDLPVMPTSVSKVIALLNETSFNLNELLAVIEQEPSMAADMIKLANSSKYKRGDKQVTDLQKAFMFMGAEGLKTGVLQVFLQKFSASSNLYFKQFGEKIWAHSFASAQYAQVLALQKFDTPLTSTIYVAALLRHLGTMVIFQLMTEAFKYVDPDAHPSSASFKALITEQALSLTIAITQHWQLPTSIIHLLQAQRMDNDLDDYGASCIAEANIISEAKLLFDSNRLTGTEFTEYLRRLINNDDSINFAQSLLEQELSLAK